MGSARRASSPPPTGSRGGVGSPSKTQDDSVDVDRRRVRPLRPVEVRERVGGGAVKHSTVEVESRSVTWTVEGLGVRVEGDRAPEVRAVDGEDIHLALVLDDEATESQLALSVVATAVGHDEGRVRTCLLYTSPSPRD